MYYVCLFNSLLLLFAVVVEIVAVVEYGSCCSLSVRVGTDIAAAAAGRPWLALPLCLAPSSIWITLSDIRIGGTRKRDGVPNTLVPVFQVSQSDSQEQVPIRL